MSVCQGPQRWALVWPTLLLQSATKLALTSAHQQAPSADAQGQPVKVASRSDTVLLAGEGHKAAKEQLALQKSTGVAKVIGLSKLRRKYEAHESKRQLCSTYDLFLADDRILPSLPKLIGLLPMP